MWGVKCPYCTGTTGRCTTTATGRPITECSSCGRVVSEHQTQPHPLFLLRAQDSPLSLVLSDLPSPSSTSSPSDPFEPTGFITTFSTWSLESNPIFARSSLSFSGQLAELERSVDSSSGSGPSVALDYLRAYLQIVDVGSILGLDYDISDHAFQLFRDCSSSTCLRNRSVEALATAALVQAIREAQEPRTLQEISIAANLPQKEIGKYIKILGEALQLSQPINSNSIAVHMPRFCTLLQLNKSAQELATHIGEVVINKCFCTRRNPISISAAAIYLACQLEDKRKTQAEICKVTGLTEVTLRKVYKELLENWDDLLPSNYTPAVPPEKAFPTTAITSGRTSSAPRLNPIEVFAPAGKDKQPEETKLNKLPEVLEIDNRARSKVEVSEHKGTTCAHPPPSAGNNQHGLNRGNSFWQSSHPSRVLGSATQGEKNSTESQGIDINETLGSSGQKIDRDPRVTINSQKSTQFSGSASTGSTNMWPFHAQPKPSPSQAQFMQPPQVRSGKEDK